MVTPLRLFLLLFSASCISVGFAQLAGTPPSCALSCIVPSNYQGCAAADTACLCTNPTAVTGVQTCIKQHCTNGTDLSAATAFLQQECNSLTASPSGTGAASSTETVSSASEATSASFGQNGTPSLLRSRWSTWWFMPSLFVLYPVVHPLLPG